MSRRTLPALLLILPLSFAPRWMDLAGLVFAEVLSAWGGQPIAPESTDTSPGMDPWG